MCVRMFGFVDASSGLAQARFECVASDKPDRGLAGEDGDVPAPAGRRAAATRAEARWVVLVDWLGIG